MRIGGGIWGYNFSLSEGSVCFPQIILINMFWDIFGKRKNNVEIKNDVEPVKENKVVHQLISYEEVNPEVKEEKKFNELVIKEMMVNKKVSREEAIRILSNPSK